MSQRRRVVVLISITSVLATSACSVLGDSTDGTLAPLLTAQFPSTTVPASTVPASTVSASTVAEPSDSSSTPSTVSDVSASVPSTTANRVVGPFPTTVPSGKCTAEAIRADVGTAPEAWLECSGAWAVTRLENCPPETECEGVDIFRWTNDGWQHRGMTYSLCVLMVDETGMPRSVNDRLLAGNTECIEPITYTTESASGSLQVGSSGTRTRRLQQRLIEWRLLNDSADGYFGANTRNAVFDVQHLVGLPPTGIADEPTMRALGLAWP